MIDSLMDKLARESDVHCEMDAFVPVTWRCCSTEPSRGRCRLSRRAFTRAVASAVWSVGRAESSVNYSDYAGNYDQLETSRVAGDLGLIRLRAQAVQEAEGEVLEIGIGTGLNIALYDPRTVRHITGIDLSEGMLALARARAEPSSIPVTLVQSDAAKLPFEDHTFDTVLDTYSLCTMPDPLAVLKEAKRVCKTHGRIVLVDHSLSSNKFLSMYQNVSNPVVKAWSKGCAWNQDIPGLLSRAGLRAESSERFLSGTVLFAVARTC